MSKQMRPWVWSQNTGWVETMTPWQRTVLLHVTEMARRAVWRKA